jgi:hypothetical protein
MEYLTQLRAGMGVSRAVPVAAEFAFADVQQAKGLTGSGSMTDIKAFGAHNRLLYSETQ